MEKQPSYVLKLSLTEIALRRVAVILWSESDILSSIANTKSNSTTYYKSENAQEIVEGKVSKLVLPEELKEQIMHIVKPIGLEIKGWKRYHEIYLGHLIKEFDVPILESVRWTTTGTVDYRKTAEELIRCEMLDIVERYQLACLYCLEEYIPNLWRELPECVKKFFYNEEDTSHIGEPFLQSCWPYILKGQESKLDNMSRRIYGNPISFHQHAFEFSACSGNKAATEYFFHKLTPKEEASLIRTANRILGNRDFSLPPEVCSGNISLEKYSEVFCYLLTLMTREQQMEIFKKKPACFLRCFLDWPWQDLFLGVADLIWTFLPAGDYDDLLRKMMDGFIHANYCFPKLFQKFFIRSPIDFKKYFVDRECEFYSFFSEFVNSQDSETIKVIFRNIDVEDRVRLVSSCNFFYLSVDLIFEGNWHIMEVCLREATLSKEDREKLKGEVFMKFLSEYDQLPFKPLRPREWKRFFQLLDEIYANTPSKGNSEVKTLTKAQRLRRKE